MADTKNPLEEWVIAQLHPLDHNTHRTPGSGVGWGIGDVQNKYMFIECKMKHTQENIIVKFKEEWLHLLHKIPLIFPVL